MPGFNSEQQRILATLARYQRKSLKLQELPEFSLFKKKHILGLIRILRLAIIVNGQRNDELLPLKLTIVDDIWTVSCEQVDWLEQNRLLSADLQTEQNYWQAVGWQLEFN
jgi:exopolyphosphatase/guanosine-5'-triphosphate,3'-diphosphate pyrophosphatase